MTITTREFGTVKWFDPTKGYGFILRKDGSEIFVHSSDIADDGLRALKKKQRVSFGIFQEDRGLRATEVRLEHSNDETDDVQEQTLPEPSYRFNDFLKVEEDRENEFKALQRARDPVRTICDYHVENYVNAFLNTNGGAIYFGIQDNGRILGLALDRAQRDTLRTRISRIINKFQPAVEPDLYEIRFVPLEGRDSAYVVEVHVHKGSASLYMTGSQRFFLRRDGSNFLMPFDMIRTRLQGSAVRSKREETRQKAAAVIKKVQKEAKAPLENAALEIDLGILLAMVFMSWSDKRITEEEIQLIQRRAQDEGLEEEDVNVLMQAIMQPPLLETVVSYLPTPESRKAAATVAYLVALSDDSLSVAEIKAFSKMCEALGLSENERNEIRMLGERTLYST